MSQRQKFGFWWFNEGGICDGPQPARRQAWWGDQPFYLETIDVFLGADPIPENARLDLNVQIGHSDGSMITCVWADRYQQSAGVSDVSKTKNFQTPWVFEPGSALIVSPYANGPVTIINGQKTYINWGVGIVVEGYLEGAGR